MSYNFTLVNADTDSIMFCKKDHSEFTEEEQSILLNEINNILPEFIKYENDGYFKTAIITKAKNYVLYDGKKIKYKGSAFKSSNKEPILGKLLKEVIEALIYEHEDIVQIYESYIEHAMNITDITPWCVKKTISKKMLSSERKNETKIVDAIDVDEVREGDKIYLYNVIDGEIQAITKGEPVFLKDGSPKMVDNKILKQRDEFDGNYDKLHYVDRVYKTIEILKNVLDMDQFTKYSLKRNQSLLDKYRK